MIDFRITRIPGFHHRRAQAHPGTAFDLAFGQGRIDGLAHIIDANQFPDIDHTGFCIDFHLGICTRVACRVAAKRLILSAYFHISAASHNQGTAAGLPGNIGNRLTPLRVFFDSNHSIGSLQGFRRCVQIAGSQIK